MVVWTASRAAEGENLEFLIDIDQPLRYYRCTHLVVSAFRRLQDSGCGEKHFSSLGISVLMIHRVVSDPSVG
jgi:hypothetical protein